MALLKTNLSPTDRQLRQFALILAAGIPTVVWFSTTSLKWTAGSLVASAIVCGGAVIRPQSFRLIFLSLVLLTTPISYLLGELILLFIYFSLFVPMALLFRIIGRDKLRRRGTKQESYWDVHPPKPKISSYFRQF